jgi:Sigma-70, region 4
MSAPDPLTEPVQFYKYVKQRQARGLGVLPPPCDHRVPQERYIEMLRLRLLEGLTLREIGERTGVTKERVRQVLGHYFRVAGKQFRANRAAQEPPDLSVRAMLARHGERRLTPKEFEEHFGHLPTDGEG